MSDTWTIDLQWRLNGINQFDANANDRVYDTFKSLYSGDALHLSASSKVGEVFERPMSLGSPKFKSSAGRKSPTADRHLSPRGLVSSLIIDTKSSMISEDRKDDITVTEMLQVKRERAQTDVQMKKERDRAVTAEARVHDLENQIVELEAKMASMKEQHDRDASELRKALEMSLSREQRLKYSNEEAYELLTLYGVKDI